MQFLLKRKGSTAEMKKMGKETNAPLVANMIKGGASPKGSADVSSKVGFCIILYPLSVLYANALATMNILTVLKKAGNTTSTDKKL